MRKSPGPLRRLSLLVLFCIGSLPGVACLPRPGQVEDTFFAAIEAFILEFGASTIEDIFTNAND